MDKLSGLSRPFAKDFGMAIQDGLVCLFGDDEMDAASRLIRKIEEGSCRFE